MSTLWSAMGVYWPSPWVLSVLSACIASMATLGFVYLTNRRNAELRVSVLAVLYSLSLFFWIFVAASFLLCAGFSGRVEYTPGGRGIQLVLGIAVLVALAASMWVTFLVWRRAPRRVLQRLTPRPLAVDERWMQESTDALAGVVGLTPPQVVVTERSEPVCLALDGEDPRVVVSAGLMDLLDREEMRAVLGHEVMHLRHRDAGFKAFSASLSRVLFFDPFSKLIDPAFHREREYLADERAARATGQPLALASALLKIGDRPVAAGVAGVLSIAGRSGGLFARFPPLRERIERLLALSAVLG